MATALLAVGLTVTASCSTGSDIASPGGPDTVGHGETTGTVGSTVTDTPDDSVSKPPTTNGGTASTAAVTEPTRPTTTAPAPEPTTTLMAAAPGDHGDAVLALQEQLLAAGFATGTADGQYGRRTTEAVRAFQLVADLEPTGQADAGTVAALGSYRYTGPVLKAGDEGPAVTELQERLASGPFDPGPVDGRYGTQTAEAVWALAKLTGMPPGDGWGPAEEKAWELLASGAVGQPQESHDQRWVEVDLSEQLMKIYDPGSSAPTLVVHVSSGNGQRWSNENHSGNSITPTGSFEIYRRISGWRESSLDIGRLYNPLYFTGGIAFHGALSVPLYPASHGCVRVPMHVAEYLPGELPDGTPVSVLA